MIPNAASTALRPRVAGDREQEILDATLEVLSDVGYDRLTMDAVATRAKASKATLYRRWSNKVSLVIDAVHSTKSVVDVPDTGSLRGDLMAAFFGAGGLAEPQAAATFASVLTAISLDADFAEAFRTQIIEPKTQVSKAIWERARERGELRADLDVELIEPALAGIVLHRLFIMGEQPDAELVSRVIDHIILPAATCGSANPSLPALTRNPNEKEDS